MIGDFYVWVFVAICCAAAGVYDILWKHPGELDHDAPDDGRDD